MMGLHHRVATSASDYVSRAAALADPTARNEARAEIRERAPRLYRDQDAVLGLEAFLRDATQQR
jgi:predicted O-linked N-acetylglucosamine transferase (SPINDLY family)